MPDITGLQIRAARALLKWRVLDLAKKSRVPVAVLKKAELLDGPVVMSEEQSNALIRLFDGMGVSLVNDPDLGDGAVLFNPKLHGSRTD